MLTRLRRSFMYALSVIIGILVLFVRTVRGDRFAAPWALIHRTATRHADRYAAGLPPVSNDDDEEDCDSCGCLDCEDR